MSLPAETGGRKKREGWRDGGRKEGRREKRTLWSLLAVERERRGTERSTEPAWASGVSGLRGLWGQGLLAVGDIKPSD